MRSLHCKIVQVPGCHNNERMHHLFFIIIEALKLNVRAECHHYFYPHGLTALAVLSESHVAMHTWPEFGLVHFDFFFCHQITAEKLSDFATTVQKIMGGSKNSAVVIDRDIQLVVT